jgi:hypothetical protein
MLVCDALKLSRASHFICHLHRCLSKIQHAFLASQKGNDKNKKSNKKILGDDDDDDAIEQEPPNNKLSTSRA